MAEHKHGSMNISEHQKTYNGFVRMVTWGTVACIAILCFLALTNA